MANRKPTRDELTEDELAQEGAADLPNREAMSLLDLPTISTPSLLNLNVDLDLALDAAAPVNAAAAANLNVAAPIDAAVSANIGTVDSTSVAMADQDSIIVQEMDADATATADQTSDIDQGE
jgi:hypothetical protein